MESLVDHNKELDLDSVDIDCTDEQWAEPLHHGGMETDSARNYALTKMEHRRAIIHFDIDCFYAQVEMLRNPELRNKPVGIQQKNLVVTTNYVARNCGVPKSAHVFDAKKICPDLVLVCGEDLTNYRQMSYRISEFLQKYTPSVERLGFDENFLDVSEIVASRLITGKYKPEFVGHVYSSNQQDIDKPLCSCGCELRLQIASQIAAEIREALEKELGITCCAGVGCNKLLAKLVAGTHKPNQQTSILPHMAFDFVTSLSSVLCIPGIGYRTSSRLNARGISSVQDLQASDKKVLEKEFGLKLTQLMAQLSCGVDDSPVIAYSQPQSLSEEDSFKCCNDLADAEQRIKDLLTCLLKRVVEDGRVPQTVRLTVRRVLHKYHRESKQCPVPANIFTKFLQDCTTEAAVERLMPLLLNLFYKLVDTSIPFHLTLISICFARLVKTADELGSIGSFFGRENAFSQQKATNIHLNETARNIQCEGLCQPITKSSPVKSEVFAKAEANVRTIKHFFVKVNHEACGSMPHIVSNEGETPSDHKLFHSAEDVSLAGVDLKERSDNSESTNNRKECSDNSFSLNRTEECSTDSYESYQALKVNVIRNTDSKQFGNISSLSGCDDRNYAITELCSSREKCLQNLLPSDLDVNTIAELPVNIQNEVLLQYGIFVEELPHGRRFTKMSDKVTTRSHHLKKPETVTSKTSQLNKKKTNATNRNHELCLLRVETSVRISKKRKIACTDGEPSTNHEANVSKIGECVSGIPSETLSKICAKKESTPCVTKIDGQCMLEDVLAPTDCYMAENNFWHPAMEEMRINTSDKLPSCSRNISVFPSTQSDCAVTCVSMNLPTHASFLNCEFNNHNEETDLEYISQNEPDVLAEHQGQSSDISAMYLQPPQTATQPSKNVSDQSSQRTVCHHKLPTNIDSEVFLSLPSNIRGEIMAHIAMGTSDSVGGQNILNTSPEYIKNVKQKNIKHKNTLLTYFKRNDTKTKKKI